MPVIQLNGASLYYERVGEGLATIAFLNGVAMSTGHWAAQTSYFARTHRVLLHDFRGQGQSSLSPEGIRFETHADDFRALLDHLGITRAHVVGVSYGAEVGMHFALKYPGRVQSLTLGTAVSESKPLLKAMIESWIAAAETGDGVLFFKVMAPMVYSNAFYQIRREWLDERAKMFGRAVSPEWFRAFIALCRNFLTLEVTEKLHAIDLPTLVVSAGEDILKPPSYGRRIEQCIPGSIYREIDGAGHALFLEKADAFNDVVAQFIASIE